MNLAASLCDDCRELTDNCTCILYCQVCGRSPAECTCLVYADTHEVLS